MAHDVFLSYSSQDKPIADAVCAHLEQQGVRCWIAPRDVLPGEVWGRAIVEAIHQSPVMVVVFSASSNESPQVMREVERAVNKGLVIIPFRIEAITPSENMEYFLSSTHWLDAMTQPLEQHIDALVRSVRVFQERFPSRQAPAARAPEPVPLEAPPARVEVVPARVEPLPAKVEPEPARVEPVLSIVDPIPASVPARSSAEPAEKAAAEPAKAAAEAVAAPTMPSPEPIPARAETEAEPRSLAPPLRPSEGAAPPSRLAERTAESVLEIEALARLPRRLALVAVPYSAAFSVLLYLGRNENPDFGTCAILVVSALTVMGLLIPMALVAYRLAHALRMPRDFLYAFVALVPWMGLLMFGTLAPRARNRLREEGVRAGLFGASRSALAKWRVRLPGGAEG